MFQPCTILGFWILNLQNHRGRPFGFGRAICGAMEREYLLGADCKPWSHIPYSAYSQIRCAKRRVAGTNLWSRRRGAVIGQEGPGEQVLYISHSIHIHYRLHSHQFISYQLILYSCPHQIWIFVQVHAKSCITTPTSSSYTLIYVHGWASVARLSVIHFRD